MLLKLNRILGLVVIVFLGTACTLSEPAPATLTPAPSPTDLPATPTEVLPTTSPTVDATDTATPAPTDTSMPPTATFIPEASLTPTPESNVSLRPPNQRTYAYDEPGTDGNLIRLIQSDQYIRVIGRTSDSTWLQVEFSDNAKGWVTASSVITTVNIEDLAITGTIIPQDYIVTVNQDADGLRLRQGPYVEENIVLFLDAGESLVVEGRLEDNSWLLVRRTNGVTGWVMRGFVTVPFDINAVPVVEAPANVELPTVAVSQPTVSSGVQATTAPQIPEPTLAPTLTLTSAPADIVINQGQVSEDGNGLRLRELPTVDSRVFFNLEELTPVTVNGRTADNAWVLIDTPSQGEGWVATEYLDLFFDLGAITVIQNPTAVQNPYAPEDVVDDTSDTGSDDASLPSTTGFAPGAYVFQTGIRGTGNIYSYGQQLGNNPYLFTKVGDSLTATAGFLYQIYWQKYNLGNDYAYLQPVIDHFGSSYGHTAKSMLSGWKSYSVLTPELADQTACQDGETPLQCEYRITRPAFALILLGTNDVYEVSPASYEAYMRDIIEISIDNGVIPIISTVPLRTDEYASQVQTFSDIIRRLASEYSIPLWDLYNEVYNLPNHGLSSDKVHLSAPGGDLDRTCDFTGDNLQYGMNARNLAALRILDSLLNTYVW